MPQVKPLYSYEPITMNFWAKRDGQKPVLLGTINTRKGRLTRAQKLRIIQANGKWVTL